MSLRERKEPPMEKKTLIEDVLFMEILPRLPVKSLIIFKRVSKEWRDFITNDVYLKKAHSRHNHTPDGLSLIAVETTDTNRITVAKLLLLTGEDCRETRKKTSPTLDVNELKLPGKEKYEHYKQDILTSSNGLVLRFAEKKSLALWNPITGESRVLPIPHPEISEITKGQPADWYLGFDKESDDHKVLRVSESDYHRFDQSLSLQVFSRKTGSWKKLENLVGFCQANCRQGVAIGSSLYFIAARRFPSFGFVIVRFSCRDDKVVHVLDAPDRSDGTQVMRHESKIGKWKENSLAMSTVNYGTMKMEFRVIYNVNNYYYGDGCRWSKLLEIDFGYCLFPGVWNDEFMITHKRDPYNINNKRELVLMDGDGVDQCSLACTDQPGSEFTHIINYVPTLHSVYPDPCN